MSDSSTLPNWLAQRARSAPDHPALICGARAIGFADLGERGRNAAARLSRLGVRAGDRVITTAGNRLELAELLYGSMWSGAVVVPISPRLAAAEIAERVKRCGASLVVYESGTRDKVADLDGFVRVGIDSDVLPGDSRWSEIASTTPPDAIRIDLDAPHSVIYTSGSTGSPKGVVLTYGNHLWSASSSAFNLGIAADDRWLACLPFAHVGGLSILMRSLIYGTTTVIHDGFDPGRVNDAIERDRVTIVSVVANMLQRMIEERGRRPYPPCLRCVLLGGGPAPRALLEACAERRLPVAQTYGLTEATSQVTTLAPRDALRKPGSVGRPLLFTEVRIVRGDRELEAGESGEIQVRGPTISPGYLGEDTSEAGTDAWFSTADLGRFDEEGFLYVLGRRDDVIVSGGENVHPAEVEVALQSHPAVAEACAVGVPDARWGEEIAAAIRTRPGATVAEGDLRDHARRSLAGFKVPRIVRFVADLPRLPSGKVDRVAVRELMTARIESDPEG